MSALDIMASLWYRTGVRILLATVLLLWLPIAAIAGQTPVPVPGVSSPVAPGPSRADVPQVVPTPDTLDGLAPSIPNPENPGGPWHRSTLTVATCTTPPKNDGKIDDPCWKTATHARGFYRSGGTSPIAEQTEAWICADSRHLYLAFHCLDSHPNLIKSGETQRDGNGVFQDDFVNLDIDSQNQHRSLSSFWVTPRGTQKANFEGGTADNITWAGDWQAATRRTRDGWTCEISVPFALLRYPRGTKSFSLALFRHLARESADEVWPYLPQEGWANQYNQEAQYLPEFTGFAPPFYTPRPVFLPYVLATTGTGSSSREGVDVKYPLSTTLTGVATVFPDFQTIEQDVTSINFSYVQKLLTDRRPFFAEGSSYLPYDDLFYSRSIGTFDGGLKIVGKQGPTSLGLLTTTASGANAQNDAVMAINQSIGLYSRVAFNYVTGHQAGLPSNQVGKFEGVYGWKTGAEILSLQADHIPSWVGGEYAGGKDYYHFATQPPPGHIAVNVQYTDIGPRYTSDLGYTPEVDSRGGGINLDQSNHFDKGMLQDYDVGVSMDHYDHHTGGFFHRDLDPYVNFDTKNGYGVNFDVDTSARDQFHDHAYNGGFSWGGKTLYQQGGIFGSAGRLAGQPLTFVSLSQGFLIARPFSVQLNFNQQNLGGTTRQTILTGTYRLTSERVLGGRIVRQNGQTNIYFSFGQSVRAGTDLFVLFGDPNSATTRGMITVKVVRPV